MIRSRGKLLHRPEEDPKQMMEKVKEMWDVLADKDEDEDIKDNWANFNQEEDKVIKDVEDGRVYKVSADESSWESHPIKDYEILNKEVNKMETKSRYEVISDLEKEKRELIMQRDSLENGVKTREKQIKNVKRQLEDMEEDLQDYKDKLKEKEETLNELIESVDESLKRFGNMTSQSQKK